MRCRISLSGAFFVLLRNVYERKGICIMKQEYLNRVCEKMIDYYSGDAKRIQHFLKVHDFARMIGMGEGVDEEMLWLTEIAAYVHDIGIRLGEEKIQAVKKVFSERRQECHY